MFLFWLLLSSSFEVMACVVELYWIFAFTDGDTYIFILRAEFDFKFKLGGLKHFMFNLELIDFKVENVFFIEQFNLLNFVLIFLFLYFAL